ncbi:MAG: N-acetylmuramoyl-L-alanine amidase [Nitrospira sp. SB0675_bin_23]|nr:N-acetylmuramoyl-L-alanine amidase [Nitrospira sp. SB0675_bin_23]
MTEHEKFGILRRRHFLPSTLMKNAFALALISCAVAWGVVTGPTTASGDSTPPFLPLPFDYAQDRQRGGKPPALSDRTLPARALLAKKGTSSGRTTAPLTVTKIRHHAHRQYTRVVLDLTGRVMMKETKNKRKATISLTPVQLSKRAQQRIKRKNFPRAISMATGSAGTVHIILDLQAIRKYRVLALDDPDRVAVDLFYKTRPAKPETRTNKPAKTVQRDDAPAGQASPSTSTTHADVLIIIDPGHGGRDPGTIGRTGTKEKAIVLQISKYLRDLIHKRHKAKVLLTRTKDVFLNLEKRVKLANTRKQEWCGKDMGSNVDATKKSRTCLFISIHVNAHPSKSIQGLEVYHFGKASDPQALEVAARENGMKVESDTPPWQFIITESLNAHKIQESQAFAKATDDKLITTLRKHYKIKNHGVKTAPFYVLRFTTMPSILAEVGFISNSTEEKRLITKAFQQKLAEGIYQGIQSYLKAP